MTWVDFTEICHTWSAASSFLIPQGGLSLTPSGGGIKVDKLELLAESNLGLIVSSRNLETLDCVGVVQSDSESRASGLPYSA